MQCASPPLADLRIRLSLRLPDRVVLTAMSLFCSPPLNQHVRWQLPMHGMRLGYQSHAPTKVVFFTLTTSRPRRLELGTSGTSRLSATVGETDLLSVTWLSCSPCLRPRSYQPQSTSTNTMGALPPSSQLLFATPPQSPLLEFLKFSPNLRALRSSSGQLRTFF